VTGPSPMRIAPQRSIRFRVYLLLAVGVVGPTAVLMVAFLWRLSQLDDQLVAGRQYAARAVAGQLDQELTQLLETLQRAASSPHFDLEDGKSEPERSALRDAYLHTHFPGGVFALGPGGELLVEEPDRRERSIAPLPDSAEVREALRSGRPAVTPLVKGKDGAHLYALVPVRNWQGKVVGLVGGVIEPTQPHFTTLLQFLKRSPDGYAELVDRGGTVLVSTASSHLRRPSECRLVGTAVSQRRPLASRCAQCHRVGDQEGYDAVLAVASLSVAPWGVSVRLPETEVLASGGALPLGLLGFGVLMIGVGGLFAWGAGRSVTKPIETLTASAERISGGDLDQPIPVLGEDEVGRLGRSLDRMRESLRQTIEQVEKANAELEQRVADRTAELRSVNAALREREQSLALLYQKVITAQEDERKRLARELHDETSQSLAVLVMGIESASAAVKAGLTPRLDEVKALAVRTIDEIHRLIRDLRPSVLDDLGLLSAIRWYAERYLGERGIAVRCEFDKLERRLAPALETAIFRVCQEAMTNVLRHAQAEAVLIQVAVSGDALRIEIEDDGKGFDPAEAAERSDRTSFGLLGIRERVELLGGRLRIDSAPGQGTRLEIEVPLPREG